MPPILISDYGYILGQKAFTYGEISIVTLFSPRILFLKKGNKGKRFYQEKETTKKKKGMFSVLKVTINEVGY